MEALRIDRLSKNFGALAILNGISLTIEAEEYAAIIGPNGAGKTTLFNVVSGELSASGGSLYLFGRDITALPAHQRVRAGLGRSFQLTRLFYDLTVIDNVSLALQATKHSRYQLFRRATSYSEIITEAEKLLKAVDLFDKRYQLVANLSYGEQRKIEIILALASKPKLLLMDEPTAGLAHDEARNFVKMVKDLAEGTTLFFTAHDMDVVFELAHRVMVLYFGQIIAEGTPEQIQCNQTVREIYLGVEQKCTKF